MQGDNWPVTTGERTSVRYGARSIAAQVPDLAQIPGPRYLALSAALSGLLLDGRLAPGTRLPSERDLAAALQLSRSTTTAAYDQLGRDGMLTRRRGSGSYLNLPAGARVAGPGARIARPSLTPDVLDLSIAALPAVPDAVEAAAVRAVSRLGAWTGALGYQPYGLPPLRELIAARYAARGVPTHPDEILVTNGAQHGIDLLLRLLVGAGDRVLTDLPTYPGALDAIRAHGARTVAVPVRAGGGWDGPALRNALLQAAPRMAYLIPDFHNPTGALVDGADRAGLVAAARRSGTVVVADESFVEVDLRPAGSPVPPAMAALDRTVISIGSLSKPIWGGLGIGWIRAESDTVARLAIIRARADMGGSVLDQLTAAELLPDLDEIAGRRRAELRGKRDALLAAIAGSLPDWRPGLPLGGLSTWVDLGLPAATALTHGLEQRGVLITPGSRFAVDGTLERFLRIPYALPVEDLQHAVDRMALAWSELDLRRLRRSEGSLVPV